MAYGGRIFRLEEHLLRLSQSAREIHLSLPVNFNRISKIIKEGISRCGVNNTTVYLQVTRGVAPRSHPFPTSVPANFFATFREKREITPKVRHRGVSVITTNDLRWSKCFIKSTALLPNVLASQKAVKADAFEAIFVTPNGLVREGAASNLFVVSDKTVRTPAKSDHVLHGITREVVLECARQEGYTTFEEKVTLKELRQADEVFLTGTTIEVLGVVKVNKETVNSGMVGPVTKQIFEAFMALTQSQL